MSNGLERGRLRLVQQTGALQRALQVDGGVNPPLRPSVPDAKVNSLIQIRPLLRYPGLGVINVALVSPSLHPPKRQVPAPHLRPR